MTSSLLSLSDPASPSVLRQFLQKTHAPNPTLSQNFLIDKNVIEKICKTANISAKDIICEIGPGPGALTKALLEQKAFIYAIEKNSSFAKELSRLDKSGLFLTVFEQDFLEVDLYALFSPSKKGKVVANLPYHLTTAIVKKLCLYAPCLQTATLMLQKDVAKKWVSSTISSLFQLELQLSANLRYGFSIPKTCFYPSPSVESAILSIDFTSEYVEHKKRVMPIAQEAFRQKRKQLKSSLKNLFLPSQVMHALKQLNKPLSARPEDLNLSNWIMLARLLQPFA